MRAGTLLVVVAMAVFSLFAQPARAGSTCGGYDSGTGVGTITDDGLDESSGITWSTVNPGIWWTHPDNHNPSP